MIIAVELNSQNIIIGKIYLVSEDYSLVLQDNPNLVLADVEDISNVIEYKTKYEDGKLIHLEDYTQEYYDNQNKQEQIANINSQLNELDNWFNEYDMQIKQYERDVRLGIVGTYHIGDNEYTIEELDQEAVIKAQQIRDLREQLKNLE